MNKTFNKKRMIIYSIIAILGVILIIFGAAYLIKQNSFYKHADKVEAKVEYILDYPEANSETYEQDLERYNALLQDYIRDGYIKEDTKVAIIINFIHNGNDIHYELGYFTRKYKMGENLNIYVDKEDSYNFIVEGRNQLGIIISLTLGSIMVLSSLVLIYVTKHNSKFNKNLLKNGEVIEAEVLYVDSNERKESFGRHPNIFTCVYKDLDTGEETYFTSDSIYSKNEGTTYIGKKVKVYVDKDNKKNYYVDVDKFEQE